MAFDLNQIRTIVVLMFENRSFDHLFTQLKQAGHPIDALAGQPDPDGKLRDDQYSNGFEGTAYYPFQMPDAPLPRDPPHDRAGIATQLAQSPITNKFTMRGFVKAYDSPDNPDRTDRPPPMGFLSAADVPVTSSLARAYLVCDRWFACLPADTHTNRLMSLSGYTLIDNSPTVPILPDQTTMLDWLTARGIKWRVYRNGLSFFTLIPKYLPAVAAGDGFRSVSQLSGDVLNEPDATFPQVILVEPSYIDAPVSLEDPPNDNHPPLPIAPGEAYLKRIYGALTANPDRWAGTLFVVTYDEHGGFYDHVPPPAVVAPVPPGASYSVPFSSAGVRTPGLVISPFVKQGSVFSGQLDNTSILQLLAERFAPGPDGYSPEVNARRAQGVQSLSAVLDAAPARTDVPDPAPPPEAPAGVVPAVRPASSPMQKTFAEAARRLKANPASALTHPGLKQWNG